jgi:hypothetical protein
MRSDRTHHLVLPSTLSASKTRWKLDSPACASRRRVWRQARATRSTALSGSAHLFRGRFVFAKRLDLRARRVAGSETMQREKP